MIEAHEARVPLLVLTADRPPELRDVGAGQTIDQVKLYGSAAKWFLEVDDHPATPERMRWLRQLACRAFWTALDGRPGPVHLNFALREPLVLDEPLPAESRAAAAAPAGARGSRARARAAAPAPALVDGAARRARARAARRARRRPRRARPARSAPRWRRSPSAARSRCWPSRCRARAAARPAVAHYDALLRDARWAAARAPELVLRVGDLPTSKPLRQWLHGLDDALQIALDPENAWQDPAGAVGDDRCRPTRARCSRRSPRLRRARPRLARALDGADRAAAARSRAALADELSEPRVAAELGARAAAGRDARGRLLDADPRRRDVLPGARDPPRVLSNRGANGIDGTVSTAFGVAAARRARSCC